MRTIAAGAATILAGHAVPMVMLVEMDLSSPLNLNTSNATLVLGGTTYYGTKGLGKISQIGDTSAEVKGLSFELSGAPSDKISLALTEHVRGKAVRIKIAIFDPTTYALVDTRLRWAGKLDTMAISDAMSANSGTSTITVTAEHAGIDLARTSISVLSDAEQQRLYPGDLFLQYTADQVEQKIVWPAREYFKK